MAESKTVKLNNGLLCPTIGLGTTLMKNVEEVVYQSIKDGTRLIDTASRYDNEVEVGKGINKAISEGIVKREDLFVITKCWIIEKEEPEKALKRSLEKLNLSYVDLYLDHWPCGKDYTGENKFKLVSIRDLWPKYEHLQEQGLTKSIGVSNYNVQNLLTILSFCKIKPVANEVEFHPYLNQKALKEFCDKEDIKLISYYPLITGTNFKSRFGRFEKILVEKKLDLLNEDIVKDLAKKYNKTPGQIILNWHIKLGLIPIPGTSNPNRMKENLGSLDFSLDKKDIELLSSFDNKQFRYCDGLGIYGIDIFA